jgi:hypothetical protein
VVPDAPLVDVVLFAVDVPHACAALTAPSGMPTGAAS